MADTNPVHDHVGGLLAGKCGLVLGVANNRSIAWGIARAFHEAGARLAFTYQGDAFGKRVQPLAERVGAEILVDADVTNDASLDRAFGEIGDRWGGLDIVVDGQVAPGLGAAQAVRRDVPLVPDRLRAGVPPPAATPVSASTPAPPATPPRPVPQ